jgi:hypothetical protein
MSDIVWGAIIAAIPSTIAAIGGLFVILRKLEQAVERTSSKIEDVKLETHTIAKSVDGAATAMVAKNDALHKVIEVLEAVIAEQKDVAKELAAIAALAQVAKSGTEDK